MMDSIQEVRELLKKAVQERGADYVYPESDRRPFGPGFAPGCQYVIDGRPGCIVGHILVQAGVSPELLHQHEGQSAPVVVYRFFPEASADVLEALDEAQAAQDCGKTWGEALRLFDHSAASWETSS